jgi:hypothetical protein
MRVLVYVWDALRTVHASLGPMREIAGLTVFVLILFFYAQGRDYLEAQGYGHVPEVAGAWPAMAFAGLYLSWHLLRHAVALERSARPSLVMRILDPSQRYDTYVALGNRVVRLYHLEVENTSTSTAARDVSVTLVSYHQTGDKKLVDIRSRLKVANSDTESLDLNPRARVAFELCGIVVNGGERVEPTDERESQTFSIVPVGSGMITVMAGARDVPSIEVQYLLYISSIGAMTIKPQAG